VPSLSHEAGPTLGSIGPLSDVSSSQAVLGRVDLSGWFAEHGRQLPWRASRDPWEVLVAEAMLQQTQVARVVDRWHRFLERFPDVGACADAAVGAVIAEWVGLGYNRRAVNLHRTAATIVCDHGGTFPSELDALLELPGIGPYTARAVRVFAFELDDGVLDTNVARILARSSGAPLPRREAQRQADAGVPSGHGWAWNQALLDIGAGHCTARRPSCGACPLNEVCRWWLAGRPDPDPAVGSAGVSTGQTRFAGSDRQGRGLLVAALRTGPVSRADLAVVMGWPDDPERAERVAAAVADDGLASVAQDGAYRLPS